MSVWSAESNPVRRGGCWGSYLEYARVAYRNYNAPDTCSGHLGLRLARRAP